jgi:CDP-diacylglycerol--glycerol-3-phosphate 3-phosphatidyltransferase
MTVPAERAEPRLLNLPNALTMARLAMVPVFVVLLLHDGGDDAGWRSAAAALFVIASITDFVDGDYARRTGQVTRFGQVADPIADKALTGAAFIGLSVLGELSWWVTGIVLAREIAVTLLRFAVIKHGVIPASRGGKAKTVLQLLALLLFLLPLDGGSAEAVRAVIMGVAVIVTVVTGLDYVVRAWRLRASALRQDDAR